MPRSSPRAALEPWSVASEVDHRKSFERVRISTIARTLARPPSLTHHVRQGRKGPLWQGRQGHHEGRQRREEEAAVALAQGGPAVPRGPHPPLPEGTRPRAGAALLSGRAGPRPFSIHGSRNSRPLAPRRAPPSAAASAPRPLCTPPPSSVRPLLRPARAALVCFHFLLLACACSLALLTCRLLQSTSPPRCWSWLATRPRI
jgi:hypothetical protein